MVTSTVVSDAKQDGVIGAASELIAQPAEAFETGGAEGKYFGSVGGEGTGRGYFGLGFRYSLG